LLNFQRFGTFETDHKELVMIVRAFLAAATLMGGLAAILPASATPLSGSALPLAQSSSSQIVLARDKHRKVWVYNRHRYGPRFTYRHGRYRYFYNGYYYANPWWTYGPGVAIGVGPGYGPAYAYGQGPDAGDRYGADEGADGQYGQDGEGQDYADQGGGGDDPHVQWCMNRYRTYDPESDSFTGYDGLQHRCNSPY
jgi:hypothetical protein